jgi:sensitive to high expression protein 9
LTVVLFTLAFLVVEPYKRKKLAQTFEARLLSGEEQNTAMLASVVGDFGKEVGSMREQAVEVENAVRLLLTRAGVHVQDGEEAKVDKDEAKVIGPSPAPPRSIEDKRRELALAGGLGFAIGAGILAAMGALRS